MTGTRITAAAGRVSRRVGADLCVCPKTYANILLAAWQAAAALQFRLGRQPRPPISAGKVRCIDAVPQPVTEETIYR